MLYDWIKKYNWSIKVKEEEKLISNKFLFYLIKICQYFKFNLKTIYKPIKYSNEFLLFLYDPIKYGYKVNIKLNYNNEYPGYGLRWHERQNLIEIMNEWFEVYHFNNMVLVSIPKYISEDIIVYCINNIDALMIKMLWG